MTRPTEDLLPRLVGNIIKRMSEEEKLELAKQFSWEELEEWKATAEVLTDKRLMNDIKKGLAEEKAGKVKPADGIFK